MRPKIAVLMGGFSKEREVSLRSGAAVARGLRQAGYDVVEIDITSPDINIPDNIQAAFIALHGEFGEDGGVQERLESTGIPYTGSGPEASRLAFDKVLSKRAMSVAGIPTPQYEVLTAGGVRRMDLPVVVKPPRQGSSFGVHRVFNEEEWDAALSEALTYNGEAMVEEYIPGRELTVGIVGDEALPVVEIRAPDSNYDYRAKYTSGVTEYLAPAPLPAETEQRCRTLALETFKVLGGRGLGRVDFRMRDDGALFVLELNTIPGFTETSLLPKAASAAGIPFVDLCRRILELALTGASA